MFASGYANESIHDVKLLYVCLATLLLLSAGNAINDYCDYHIDLINKPKRPLPSGRIPRNHALIFTIVLIAIGIGLGVLINIYAVGISILVSVLLVSYAMWLKRTPLIGNLVVGCLTGITFISGGVAIGTVRGTLVPAVFAFLFTTAREIVKDLEDIEGDKRQNIRTLAILNTRLAVIFALSFIVAVIVFSPIPYIFGYRTGGAEAARESAFAPDSLARRTLCFVFFFKQKTAYEILA